MRVKVKITVKNAVWDESSATSSCVLDCDFDFDSHEWSCCNTSMKIEGDAGASVRLSVRMLTWPMRRKCLWGSHVMVWGSHCMDWGSHTTRAGQVSVFYREDSRDLPTNTTADWHSTEKVDRPQKLRKRYCGLGQPSHVLGQSHHTGRKWNCIPPRK